MKLSIENLDAGLQEIIETQGRSSKAKIIRGLFDRITEAMEEGITLDMLVDYLHQNEILITKNSLRNTLYRIRKERGEKTKNKAPEITPNAPPVIATQSKSSLTEKTNNATPPKSSNQNENEKILDDILERFSAVKDLEGRYLVLGGDLEDFKNKSIADRRQLVTNLKMKVMRQYGF